MAEVEDNIHPREQASSGNYSKAEHTYALGREPEDQAAILKAYYVVEGEPEPHTDQLGPAFPKEPKESQDE